MGVFDCLCVMSSVPATKLLSKTMGRGSNTKSKPEETSPLLEDSSNATGSLSHIDLKSASAEITLDIHLPAPPSARTIRKKTRSAKPSTADRERAGRQDLLQSFQTRALTESTSTLYDEIVKRPTIYEYEVTVRDLYGISDDINPDAPIEHGKTFMNDLRTKRQGIVPFQQIIDLGNNLKRQMI